MSLLIDIQLFPCVSFFKLLNTETDIKIDVCESFRKSSFHNRYVISGANGIINLTIPVVGGREQKALITDIQVDHSTNWPERHMRSITSAYRKAPFFDFYASVIHQMLFSQEKSLFNFNMFILTRFCSLLNISNVFSFTEDYQPSFDTGPEGRRDYRNRFLPSNFQEKGEYWEPRYFQLFEDRIGFQPNLSVLDLLFCEGPNAKHLLEKSH